MELLVGFFGAKALVGASTVIGAVILGWLFKKIPTKLIKRKFGQCMFCLGVAITLGLAKWKWTKGLWNKTIEPFVVHFIEDIVLYGISEFIRGLKSDN